MTTGHIIVIVGICITAAGALLLTVGGALAAHAKRDVLKKIKMEYR